MSEPLVRWATSPLVGERRTRALTLLTPAEASRLESERHPERFLTGRMLLREVAAELTGRPLPLITIAAACPDCGREHGQPRIQHPVGAAMNGLFVSLSHASDVTVAAASASPVGVDIEPRDVSLDRLAAIRDVAGGNDLTHWTRVEAVLKADGRGLRVDPRAVSIQGEEATIGGRRHRLTAIADGVHIGTVANAL